MKENRIKESYDKFYDSVERLKEALSNQGLKAQDYNLEIPNTESDRIRSEVLNNEGKYGILFTYNGTVKLNPISKSCYATELSVEGVYLRKFYPMKNKRQAQDYCEQIKTSSNLLDVPVFGFVTLGDDLLQEFELELSQDQSTRKLTSY